MRRCVWRGGHPHRPRVRGGEDPHEERDRVYGLRGARPAPGPLPVDLRSPDSQRRPYPATRTPPPPAAAAADPPGPPAAAAEGPRRRTGAGRWMPQRRGEAKHRPVHRPSSEGTHRQVSMVIEWL